MLQTTFAVLADPRRQARPPRNGVSPSVGDRLEQRMGVCSVTTQQREYVEQAELQVLASREIAVKCAAEMRDLSRGDIRDHLDSLTLKLTAAAAALAAALEVQQ